MEFCKRVRTAAVFSVIFEVIVVVPPFRLSETVQAPAPDQVPPPAKIMDGEPEETPSVYVDLVKFVVVIE